MNGPQLDLTRRYPAPRDGHTHGSSPIQMAMRRIAELELVNTHLRRSNQELEYFGCIASHDLREPLRQIESLSIRLQHAFADGREAPENIARWFAGIADTSRRLRNLIDDIAKHAKCGATAPAFALVDLGQMIAALLQDFESQLAEMGGTIAAGPLPVIMCDATSIRQAFQNLIGNAIKYRHPDRRLHISIDAEQSATPTSTWRTALPVLVVRITDNGIGFDPGQCERIFEPFERLHAAEAYPGSGLGLAICRRVAKQHGGTVTAASRIGEGAVFTMTLPLLPIPDRFMS